MQFLKVAIIRQRITGILLIIATYRIKNPKAFILIQSLLIGLIAGLIAVLLKNIVHYTGRELYKNSSPTHPQFLYLALPGINIMFDQELFDTTFVIDYYIQSPAVIDYHDSFERIMKVFDETQAWNLPVLKNGKFAGVISKSMLYSEYRKLIVQLSDE